MENKRFSKQAALIFGIVAACSGMGCLITGMGFWKVPMFPVVVAIAVAAAITVFTADKKWFAAIPGVFVLLCIRLWRKGQLEVSLEAFLGRVSLLYDMGYGWGIIRWTDEVLLPDSAQLALCIMGAWLAMGICRSFLRCKGTVLPLLLTCLPVIPCMLLTDTVPNGAYLYGMLVCCILLLLVRLPKKEGHGEALLRLSVVPVAVAVLGLMLLLPQKNYTRLEKVDALLSWVQGLVSGSGTEGPQTPVREEGSWVNLGAVGPKNHRRGTVMDVTASQDGYLYLRGKAFDTYYGTWWDCKYTAPAVTLPPSTSQRTVRVTTKAMHDVLYLPYGFYGMGYSNSLITVYEEKGQVANAGPWRSYNAKYRVQPSYNDSWQLPSEDAPAAYTHLTDSAREAAENYLERKLPSLPSGMWSRAEAIVQHVSESAVYSLNTPKMPADTKDFAMWFLEESDSGYCIHFATAATVLLRAAGIPCRYMTGYLVYAQANRMVEVQNQNAHAWVEVFIDGVGWVPMEPTPAGGIPETADPGTTAPSETETIPVTGPVATAETEATAEGTAESATEATTAPTAQSATETTNDTAPPERLPTHTTETPDSATIGGADGPEEKDLTLLKWGISFLAVAALTICQWRLRVWLRLKKRRKGRKNARALALWREVELHCRVRKEAPEQRLLQLAQKAKFSQHAITAEELKEFENWLNGSKNVIRRKSLWKQLLATIIYALY